MRAWDRDLSEKALSLGMLLVIFCVLTWFNASDFDWELHGEGGTVTLAMLGAVATFLYNMRTKPSENRQIKKLQEICKNQQEQLNEAREELEMERVSSGTSSLSDEE